MTLLSAYAMKAKISTEQQDISRILRSLAVTPSKGRGQNFLYDKEIAWQIVDFAEIKTGELVLEIGPGIGALTNILIDIAHPLYVAEIESKFCAYLQKTIPKLDPKSIFCLDFRELHLGQLCLKHNVNNLKIISNTPYSLSSEILFWLMRNRKYISSANLLLQKEFAQRVASKHGSKSYGTLSIWAQLYCNMELGFEVAGDLFYPKADVTSQMLKLTIREKPQFEIDDEIFFEKLIRTAFSHRRKTLLNSISGSNLFPSKESVHLLLSKSGINPQCRAESLPIEDFITLYNNAKHFIV